MVRDTLRTLAWLVPIAVVCASASPVAAQIPRTMTVQGILRDATGTPVEGGVPFEFELTRGTATVWTESHTPSLDAGLFTIVLGLSTPIVPDLFASAPVSLVVTVDGEAMDPIALTSVAYAFRASSAETADAYTGDVDWGQLTGVPAGFADGTDDGTSGGTYVAGAGLTLTGDTFAAAFGGDGAASTVARSDHAHAWSSLTSVPAGFADGVDDTGGVPAWSSITGVPAGFADGVDDTGGVPTWSSIIGVPAGFADGTDDVGDAWSGLTGIPAGFADGVDDTGGPPAWSSLTGVPAGFSDGTDNIGDAWSGLTGVPAGFADGIDDTGSDDGCSAGILIDDVCVLRYDNTLATDWNTAATTCAALGADLCSSAQYLALVGPNDYYHHDLFYSARAVWSRNFSDNDTGRVGWLNSADNPITSNPYGYACCSRITPALHRARGTIVPAMGGAGAGILATYIHVREDTVFPTAAAICRSLRSDLCSAAQYVTLNDAGTFSAAARRATSILSDNDGLQWTAVLGTNTADDPSWASYWAFACCAGQGPLDGSCPGGTVLNNVCTVELHETADTTFAEAARACARRSADICSNSQMQNVRNAGRFAGIAAWTNEGADNDGNSVGGLLGSQPNNPTPADRIGYACCL